MGDYSRAMGGYQEDRWLRARRDANEEDGWLTWRVGYQRETELIREMGG